MQSLSLSLELLDGTLELLFQRPRLQVLDEHPVRLDVVLVALLHVTDDLDFGLEEGLEVRPVGVQLLQVELHAFHLLVLDALEIVLAQLPVDVEDLVQLVTVALRLLADSDALLHEVLVHLTRIHMLLETASRDASALAPVPAPTSSSSGRVHAAPAPGGVLALQFSLPHAILDLGVDDLLPTAAHQEALGIDVMLSPVRFSHDELALTIVPARHLDALAIVAVELVRLRLAALKLTRLPAPGESIRHL